MILRLKNKIYTNVVSVTFTKGFALIKIKDETGRIKAHIDDIQYII